MADHIPLGYAVDGDVFCVPCTFESFAIVGNPYELSKHQDLWDITDAMGAEAHAIYSWDETSPHGVGCSTCEEEIAPAWCEAADPSMAGNGFCGECDLEAMDTMGEPHE